MTTSPPVKEPEVKVKEECCCAYTLVRDISEILEPVMLTKVAIAALFAE